MQHKSFETMSCPIARSLERVGEWWSMLIMRDALHGMTRFDEFQKSLGIAPNMLAPPLQRSSAARRICADRARARFSPDSICVDGLGQPTFRARGAERHPHQSP